MKNRKIIYRFAVIMIAVICAFCACYQKQINEEENDFRVTPSEDGKSLVITRYLGKKQAVNIPSQLYKLPVTGIRKETFLNKDLVNVIISSSVTTIGDKAFSDNDLISVTLGSGVTSIGDAAFSDNQLSSISLPSSLTTIGAAAFHKNKLTAISIPSGVTTIGDGAFANNKFTTVTIPAGVSSIGVAPFVLCQDLTAINVSTSNKSYASADGVLYNKSLTELIQWPSGKMGDAVIPSGVTTIKSNAFASGQLSSVTIPDSVTVIELGAFADNQLATVTIGNGVTTIGEFAFQNNKLASVTIPSSVTAIGNGAFIKNQLTSVTIGADVTLENSYYGSSFGFNFEYYYRNAGKKAGTYTRPNANSYEWSRKD